MCGGRLQEVAKTLATALRRARPRAFQISILSYSDFFASYTCLVIGAYAPIPEFLSYLGSRSTSKAEAMIRGQLPPVASSTATNRPRSGSTHVCGSLPACGSSRWG